MSDPARLVAALGEAPPAVILVLTQASLPLLEALQARHGARIGGARIGLVALDPRGRFGADWAGPARARLLAAGFAADRVRVIDTAAGLGPCDLLLNLAGFGDTARVKHLEPVLRAALRPGTRMLTDIRKGSGAHPFLRDWGGCETLSTIEEDGATVTRALFTARAVAHPAVTRPMAPADQAREEDGWPAIAAALAGADGFLRDDGQHSFLFIPRGDVLVVTFDNLDLVTQKREDRRPWGFAFIEKQGWSMLGVMANGWTWYRDPWVWAEFDRLAAEGFFARFRRVVFYGASMGGYAACAFVPACPGADVVAISPQSTLDRALVPWETRYRAAWGRDFSGRYGDAAEASRAAGRVTILFDPYEPLDAAHVARFRGGNLRVLRAPLLGHRLGTALSQMGVLSAVILAALEGQLTEAGFYRALRARRGLRRYQSELFRKALARGHPELARRLGRWVLTRGDNRFIRRAMRELETGDPAATGARRYLPE